MKTIETAQLFAEIRAAVADELESSARYRENAAEWYPEDKRNARAAYELRRLADEMRSNDIYDSTPAFRKLLDVVTTHGIDDLSMLLLMDSEDGDFNSSLYRFHDATENDDEFLSRFADAVEAWWSE